MRTPCYENPYCVEFNELIRATDSPSTTCELGSGLPQQDPFPAISNLLHQGLDYVLRSGLDRTFGIPDTSTLHGEMTRQLSDILCDDIDASRFLVSDGTSDALSFVFEYCASNAIDILLPLPCYFGYEIAAARVGARIAGYYRLETGQICWTNESSALCLVINVPDALTGSTATLSEVLRMIENIGVAVEVVAADLICAGQGITQSMARLACTVSASRGSRKRIRVSTVS